MTSARAFSRLTTQYANKHVFYRLLTPTINQDADTTIQLKWIPSTQINLVDKRFYFCLNIWIQWNARAKPRHGSPIFKLIKIRQELALS